MAQTYLSKDDTNFIFANNNTPIFGNTGTESVFIKSGVTGVVMDQNTERIDFEGAVGDFTYQQAGNQLLVFSSGVKTATIPIKIGGTQLVFSDGSTDVLLTLGVMTMGGTTVTPDVIAVVPGSMDSSTTSSPLDSGTNQAMIFLDAGDTNYKILNTGSTVFGNSETESLLVAPGVRNITTDQNTERVDIQGEIADFTYQQAGNQLIVFSNGAKVITIPIQNNDTQLVFLDGSVNVLLQTGVMTLGDTTVSTTAGAVYPTTIDTTITAEDGITQPVLQTISIDIGTLETAVSLDASDGAFNFTDNAIVMNNVVITNVTSDDTISVFNATATDYSFSNDGTDVIISYNDGGGTINVIRLTGIVSTNDLIYDEASFESAMGFDAFTIASNNDNTDLLSAAQSKSASIPGINHDTLVPLNSSMVATLYEGDSWLNFQNVSDPIIYSFNETLPPEYTGSDTSAWQPVPSNVREVIDEVISIADGMILTDIEKAFGSGQIRFNMVETDQGTAAYAYMPGPDTGGDVFLGHDIGTDANGGSIELFGPGRSSIIHELGHALGLTHPFEGLSVLPSSEDHSANTVMSYTDYQMLVPQFTGTKTGSGSQVEFDTAIVAPDRFMLYDIAVLQAIYGPDPNYRTGEDTYAFDDESFYTTIWDAGGYDILDFSATAYYNVIDLTPGSHSNINYRDIDTQIADQQAVYQQQLNTNYYDDWVADTFNSISSDLYTGENALGIAWGTIIEKVTGGPAGNRFIDNVVDNYLTGGAGDDLFYLGAGGFDKVSGGGGYDLVVLNQYTRNEVELESYEESVLLAGDDFSVQMTGVAGVQFADQLYVIA